MMAAHDLAARSEIGDVSRAVASYTAALVAERISCHIVNRKTGNRVHRGVCRCRDRQARRIDFGNRVLYDGAGFGLDTEARPMMGEAYFCRSGNNRLIRPREFMDAENCGTRKNVVQGSPSLLQSLSQLD
jgi:hypothetical protein